MQSEIDTLFFFAYNWNAFKKQINKIFNFNFLQGNKQMTINIQNIPQELRELNQWAFSDISLKPPFNKIPKNCKTRKAAKSNDRTTWSSFADFEALGANPNYRIGFMLSKQDSYCVIDLDVKADTPEQQIKYFEAVVARFNSYTERSTSGRGFHIWLKDAHNEPGVRSGKEELYTQERYIICTGDVYLDRPIRSVNDCIDDFNSYKAKLSLGRKSASKSDESYKLNFEKINKAIETNKEINSWKREDIQLSADDIKLIEYIKTMPEGNLFVDLMNGYSTNYYQSASEADFALCKILCKYTQDDIQVLKIFKSSKLGEREKVSRRLDYPKRTVANARCQVKNEKTELQLNKLTAIKVKEKFMQESEKQTHEKSKFEKDFFNLDFELKKLPYPPAGTKLEKLCRWIYDASFCAVDEISIITGIAAFAGLFGHQYNVSGAGLNLYLMLIAKSGVGKNAINDCLDRLQKRVEEYSGSGGAGGGFCVEKGQSDGSMQIYTFMTQQYYASSAALMSLFAEDNRRSVISVWSEFGQKLKQFSVAKADSRMAEMKQLLTSIYDKSGKDAYIGGIKYSNKTNDKVVKDSFAFSIIGETTPGAYEDGINSSMAEDGFLSRFITIEYNGDTENNVYHTEDKPDVPLEILELFHAVFYSTADHGIKVEMTEEAKWIYTEFLNHKDRMLSGVDNEAIRQLWSRAPLKALKLAALLACGENLDEPTINGVHLQWALEVLRYSIQKLFKRINETGLATAEKASVQLQEMKRVIGEFVKKGLKGELPEKFSKFVDLTSIVPKITIPHSYLSSRLTMLKSFSNSANTIKSIESAEMDLINQGVIIEVSRKEALEDFFFTGRLFRIADINAF